MLCEPTASKRRPQSSIDGKFSIPFTAAVMMAKGTAKLLDYSEDGLRDPAVLAMADRVHYRRDADAVAASHFPRVDIRCRDGRVLSRRVSGVPGDSAHPVDRTTLHGKFRDCLSFAARPVGRDEVERVIALVETLETIPDVREITKILG